MNNNAALFYNMSAFYCQTLYWTIYMILSGNRSRFTLGFNPDVFISG